MVSPPLQSIPYSYPAWHQISNIQTCLHGAIVSALRRRTLRRHRSVSATTSLYAFAVDTRGTVLVGVGGVAARVVDVEDVESVNVAGDIAARAEC